jgi:ankyrin repeat protein
MGCFRPLPLALHIHGGLASGGTLQVQRLGYTYDSGSFFQAIRAQDVKAVGAFLDAGMSANLQNADGHLLVQAARTGNLQIVQSLVDHGADLGLAGRSALLDAAYVGSEAVVKTLLQRVTLTKSDASYALWIAAKRGDARIIALFAKAGADVDVLAPAAELVLKGMTPLMVAAGYGHLEAVKALIEGGADVNRDRVLPGDT